MTKEIQIYAESVTITPEGKDNNVFLNGIQASQVIAEFSAKEVLECIETSEIESFLAKKLREA